MLRGFDKTWNADSSRQPPAFPSPRSSTQEEPCGTPEDGNLETSCRPIDSDVTKMKIVPKPVHQVPNVKYPILRYKARNFVKIGIDETRLRGRKVLVPQKVTVKLEKLIPFNVVADSEEFKVFQETEEWEFVRYVMNQRSKGGEEKEHYDVTEEEEVRVGPYSLCTKCANLRKKPKSESALFLNDENNKRVGIGDTTMYSAWRRSLLELQPYLDRRERLKKDKERSKAQSKVASFQSGLATDSQKHEMTSTNFDEAYELLMEAMNKIETSSDRVKKRIGSSTGSSTRFAKDLSFHVSRQPTTIAEAEETE